jgi:hypothetical protein
MNQDQDDERETLVEEFFRAGHMPADTHEEWLLRLCSQLMHREAHVISVLEAQQRASNSSNSSNRRRPPRGRGQSEQQPGQQPGQQPTQWMPPPCSDLDASTAPSMATDDTISSES